VIIPVILSGGSGTRLWPLSRQAYPKQLLALTGDDTLIQQTIKRVKNLDGVTDPLVVCNEEHRFLIAEQLRQIEVKPMDIILEPIGKNTAPAIAAAAFRSISSTELDKNIPKYLLILPADHLIGDVASFQNAVIKGMQSAAEGKLVTFGIVPSSPHTGYGYIKKGKKIEDDIFAVDRFVEKPPAHLAEEYLASQKYFWNSGMFLFETNAFLEEIEKYEPDMFHLCRNAVERATRDLDFLRLDKEAFEACPSNSVDYAVMEKTDRAVVVSLDSQWSDIGSWSSLWEASDKDGGGNVIRGDVIMDDVSDSLLFSQKRLLAALGIKGLVIVETPDAILVADKYKSQDVKRLVEKIKKQGREEFVFHSKVYRPWGSYERLVSGDRFQVKLIEVKPGAKLSVQMHHHRAEHWIVVKGTAKVQKGEETILLTENESTFIPLGTVHSLENPGKIPLELIEVQSGSYLGEDDIVRFEDMYGRTG